ncbi:hypothetical protein ASG17_07535 [Brevundimonas sp. Leaf363]|uniref:hypothetical protein n=1 Tax=Brevundimonas sp. Leaf363 TaxID=1736353 RepID=UPI0006F9A115|nr:hypothetical protein [Brevundimonas sp. Leaf363]KQS55893.1 hypothetical protein ASG17_07535 [Brevundimonas sp. Leaf363]
MSPKVVVNGGASRMADGSVVPILQQDDPGPKGDTGASGWTPMFRGVQDSARTLIELYDWSGGAGAKPATGYLTASGSLASAKADGFNFNAIKRVMELQAVTNAQGVATFSFNATPAFANPPIVIPTGNAPVTGGPVSVEEVAGSRTATGVKIQAKQAALVTGVLSLLVGATVRITVIEV